MAANGPPSPHAARVASYAVRKKIDDVVGNRVPPSDRGDVAQQVYLRLLLMKDLPAKDDELLGLVVCVARGLVRDFHRRRAVRERRTAADADVDAVAFDAEIAGVVERDEWRRALEFVEAEVAAGRVDASALRWARRLADGDTLAQIAADDGIPVAALKSRLHRVRKHLRKHWSKYAAGLAGVAVLLLMLRPEQPEGVTHGNPYAAPQTDGASPALRPGSGKAGDVPSAPPERGRNLGAEYRAEASRACAERDYAECALDLDRARATDPDGERSPEVKAMRDAIDRAMRDGAVPR